MRENNSKMPEQQIVLNENKLEPCVVCWKLTDIPKNMPINLREFYVGCAGQLCQGCHEEIYPTREIDFRIPQELKTLYANFN